MTVQVSERTNPVVKSLDRGVVVSKSSTEQNSLVVSVDESRVACASPAPSVVVVSPQRADVVANTGVESRVVIAGSQGLEGARGPIGPPGSGSAVIDIEASEYIPALWAVAVSGGFAVTASSDTRPHVVGISREEASPGLTVPVVTAGVLSVTGVGLTPGAPYFLAADGSLSTAPPTTGYVVRIGSAVTSDTLTVVPQEPVLLS